MHELKDYSNKGIEKWLKEQEEYATPLRQRNESDPCNSIGTSIMGCVDGLRQNLLGYREEQVLQRCRQIHRELIDDWKKNHRDRHVPPQDVLRSLDADAAKRAFCEQYSEIAHLAKEIAELRTQAETQFKC